MEGSAEPGLREVAASSASSETSPEATVAVAVAVLGVEVELGVSENPAVESSRTTGSAGLPQPDNADSNNPKHTGARLRMLYLLLHVVVSSVGIVSSQYEEPTNTSRLSSCDKL